MSDDSSDEDDTPLGALVKPAPAPVSAKKNKKERCAGPGCWWFFFVAAAGREWC